MANPLLLEASAVRKLGRLDLSKSVAEDDFQQALEGQARLAGPLSVELTFSVRRGQVAVRGQVTGEWELECCRCLGRSRLPYGAQVEASFAPEAGKLDAAEEVRQALVLALPMRAYCRPDCRGLCPTCGANRNQGACGCPEAKTGAQGPRGAGPRPEDPGKI